MSNPNPLAGTGGKPLIGKESPGHRYVGRVIVELYEGPDIRSDADGLVMIISPSLTSSLSQQDLLKRIAAALPGRVALRERTQVEQIKENAIQQHKQDS